MGREWRNGGRMGNVGRMGLNEGGKNLMEE